MTALRGKLKGASQLALGVACALSLAVGLGGCSHMNPFQSRDAAEGAVASQGQRLSIVAFEQKLEPSKSLKGVGYYLPAVQPVASWPVAGGPQDVAIENADAARDFKVAWTKSIGTGSKDGSEVLTQPVSDGRLIYVMDGEARVSALDVNTGAQVWSVNLDPHYKRDKKAFGGGLALSQDGKLFVTSGYRFISALDPATGKTLWQKPVDTQLHSAPTVGTKYVYATDVDNQIFAFDQSSGEMDWTYQAIAEPARLLKTSAPIVSGNVVYAPFSSGELVALSDGTGTPLWDQVLAQSSRTNALSEIRDISGRPVLSNDKIFAASHSGVFQAMNIHTGDPVWTVPVDSINTPWVAGDVVFLVSLQGELICVSKDSGQIYWLKDLNAGIAKTNTKANKGFFGIGKGLMTKDVPLWAGPVMASNRLVMVNSTGQAVALDPKTGDQISSLSLGGAGYLTPIVAGDKLFVVTDDAKLVAIR